MKRTISTIFCISIFCLIILAAPGDLDTTFDSDGKVTTDLGGTDRGRATAIQADGKIVVAGVSSGDFTVTRYNTDSSLDTSFDTDGKVTTDFNSGSSDSGNAVAIQADGKIVVAGSSNNGSNSDFAVVRYNTDGSLDTSFDSDGKVTTGFFGSGNDVVIQVDGKIVAAGSAGGDFALARYNTNGSLDTSFDSDGKVTTDFNSGSEDNGQALEIQIDGKIVVAGSSDNDFAVARYESAPTTAASVSISGRVLYSDLARRGIPNAIVHITDQNGNVRTTRTNQFGYYRFDNVEVGQSLIMNAYHRRYQFDSKVGTINENLKSLNFMAQ